MTNYGSLSQRLTDALHLTLPPVAMWFTDTAPAGVAAAPTHTAAGCAFWEKGAQKTFVTTPQDHEACAIGTYTHNLEGTPAHEKDRADALGIFAQLGYLPASELAPSRCCRRARPSWSTDRWLMPPPRPPWSCSS